MTKKKYVENKTSVGSTLLFPDTGSSLESGQCLV